MASFDDSVVTEGGENILVIVSVPLEVEAKSLLLLSIGTGTSAMFSKAAPTNNKRAAAVVAKKLVARTPDFSKGRQPPVHAKAAKLVEQAAEKTQ
jgi:hypothetical protein